MNTCFCIAVTCGQRSGWIIVDEALVEVVFSELEARPDVTHLRVYPFPGGPALDPRYGFDRPLPNQEGFGWRVDNGRYEVADSDGRNLPKHTRLGY